MPLRDANILIQKESPHEGAAALLAELAYPNPADVQRRRRFQNATCSWAIDLRSRADVSWAESPQPIRPVLVNARISPAEFKRGFKLVAQRLAAARYFLTPHLIEAVTGKMPLIDDFVPTQENMALQIIGLFEWSTESVPNVKGDIWKPSRPVVHAALALAFWLVREKGDDDPIEPLFEFLFSPEAQTEVVNLSEKFRNKLDQMKAIKFAEGDTIRFQIVT